MSDASGFFFHVDGDCPCGEDDALCDVEGHPHGPHGCAEITAEGERRNFTPDEARYGNGEKVVR